MVSTNRGFRLEVVGSEMFSSLDAQHKLRELSGVNDSELVIIENSQERVNGYFTDREIHMLTSNFNETGRQERVTCISVANVESIHESQTFIASLQTLSCSCRGLLTGAGVEDYAGALVEARVKSATSGIGGRYAKD